MGKQCWSEMVLSAQNYFEHCVGSYFLNALYCYVLIMAIDGQCHKFRHTLLVE